MQAINQYRHAYSHTAEWFNAYQNLKSLRKFLDALSLVHAPAVSGCWHRLEITRRVMMKCCAKPLCVCVCVCVCRTRGDDSQMLVCEVCDKGYHTYCLQPVMEHTPTNRWRCKVRHTHIIRGNREGGERNRHGQRKRKGYLVLYCQVEWAKQPLSKCFQITLYL